jgi:hypothetical protein
MTGTRLAWPRGAADESDASRTHQPVRDYRPGMGNSYRRDPDRGDGAHRAGDRHGVDAAALTPRQA